MSAAPKIIEGTWEDITRHAAEFAGHRLKVIVMDDPAASPAEATTSNISAEEWVAWLEQWAHNRPPLGPGDDSRDAIYSDRLDRQL